MCWADNDVMMRAGFNGKGNAMWEYILVYLDDFLVIAADPKLIISLIDKQFKIKEGSDDEPTQYFGAAPSTNLKMEHGHGQCPGTPTSGLQLPTLRPISRVGTRNNSRLKQVV
jgi:hypothetical protein